MVRLPGGHFPYPLQRKVCFQCWSQFLLLLLSSTSTYFLITLSLFFSGVPQPLTQNVLRRDSFFSVSRGHSLKGFREDVRLPLDEGATGRVQRGKCSAMAKTKGRKVVFNSFFAKGKKQLLMSDCFAKKSLLKKTKGKKANLCCRWYNELSINIWCWSLINYQDNAANSITNPYEDK